MSLGCSPLTADSTPESPARIQALGRVQAESIDAGVVFADENSYLCFPLARFGIAPADEVLSISSSCDCVVGSIATYLDTSDSAVDGLRIRFLPEPNSGNSNEDFTPVSLMVTLTLQLQGGPQKVVLVEYLRVMRVSDVARSKEPV